MMVTILFGTTLQNLRISKDCQSSTGNLEHYLWEEEKAIISIFRFVLGFDKHYKEVNNLELQNFLAKEKDEEQKTSEVTTTLEEKINEMEI